MTTLTLVDIDKDQRLYQRDTAGFYDVTVAGTSDATNAVQARAIDSYTGAVVVDWTTVAVPSGGSYSGKLRCPARIRPCKLEVRDAVNTSSVKTGANRFYVGAHWILWGQSNAVNWPGGVYKYPLGGQGSLTYYAGYKFVRAGYILDTYESNKLHSSYSTVNSFPAGSATVQDGAVKADGIVYMLNILSEALNCAVCITTSATGGQGIGFWAPGQTGWTNLTTAVMEIGGDAEGAILYQGEADASFSGTTTENYMSALASRQSQFHSLTGRTASTFKFGVVSLGAVNANGGYVASIDKVRAAEIQFANNTPGAFLLAANHDSKTSDGVHVVGISFSHLGAAGGKTLAYQYGVGVSGAGPRVVSATRTGAEITLTVQHAGGTNLLDGAGGSGTALTGFRVRDAGTAAVISATAITGPITIKLTLSAVPSGTVTVDYGMIPAPHSPDQSSTTVDPVWASAVYDNVVLVNQDRGCILQPFAAINVTGG
jgi:hypothetical protein